ncbi:MAG: single-stranded DNA-binding protein [Campylobacterota bacterium]|nr:single-stranded DNA-binding protein [Campylobacterota bacterium]
MFNKVILVGNLTRDIELKYSQAGLGIASAGLATNRKFTVNGEKKEEVCFVDITFFGRSAEVANQYLRKGSKILVEGRLKLDQWTDQNGQKRSKHGVIVETMQMLDSKGDNQGGGYQQAGGQQQPQSYNQAPQQAQSYQQPQQQQSYGQNEQQQQQQYQAPQQQQQSYQQPAKEMPSSNDVPVIDIDEDEIPF